MHLRCCFYGAGFLGGMWVAVVAAAGACLYFVLWSYFFASVLQVGCSLRMSYGRCWAGLLFPDTSLAHSQWENNTVTFLYLLYLLFNAYWISNVVRYILQQKPPCTHARLLSG